MPDPADSILEPWAFQPEESTAVVVPTTAINVAGALANWVNPSAALPTSGAGSTLATSGSGNTGILQCAPAPASAYASINDGADITKFVITEQISTTRSGTYSPGVSTVLMNGGAQVGSFSLATGNLEGEVFVTKTQTLDKVNFFPAGITGSQLKNGTYGPGFIVKSTDAATAGTNAVRSVTMQVFYQNPIPDNGATLFCEA